MRIDFLELLRQRRVRACFRDAVDGYRALDMVLVTNGHGGRDMALIPRVNSDLSQDGAASAMREMLESDDNGAPPAPDIPRVRGFFLWHPASA